MMNSNNMSVWELFQRSRMIEQPMYPAVTADMTKRVGSWGGGRDHHNCVIILLSFIITRQV
jgi:hypothetical protein